MKRFFALTATILLATLMLVGCGSNSSNPNPGQSQSGNVFVTGEDAPLPSVVGLNLTINSITLNGQSNSPQVISTPTTVDFARLLGLRSPLAFNSVPADTYSSATFVLANPVISWVDMSQNPPAVSPMPGTLPQSPYTMTVNFPTPMVVGSNGLAGLKMEFDVRQSLAVSNGQISGAVNPVIYIKATKASDPDGQLTDLTGGLVSVTTANNSFVMQGPYGRQLTVYVNGSTQFNSGWSMTDLAAPAIVGVQGAFQADGSLMASGVEVITTAESFLSGRVLQVTNNGAGQAQSVTMWVGETGADLVSEVDTIQTIDISAVTEYEICFLDGPLTGALFNNTSIEVGQRIFIGGSYVNPTFTPQMISLRRQGVYGLFVPGSVTVSNGNAGFFQLSNNGLVGYAAGGPVTVYTGNGTLFFNLSGLSALAGDTTAVPLVTRGLLLQDPNNKGNLAFFAGLVAEPPQTTSN
ncbi:MAG TPA: DUF4382 domain-containing protein [Terriglobales bacterium]|nr:DUF4382 domain-containing protein [Terriglobales bacterium]